MIRERLASRRQDANNYEAASNFSRKVGLPEFPYKRLLKVLVAVSILISFPISVHATLYVLVLDAREIAIASDGKWLIVSGDNSAPVWRIKEKVIRLRPQLAFMCDGRTEIDTTSVKIHATELAKQLNHEYQSQGGSNHLMAVLAGAFSQVMSERLNQLSPEQRNQIFLLGQQLVTPGRQLLECLFAGRDSDNKLKIETVDVLADSSADPKKYLSYHVAESIGDDSPHLILSGEVASLRAAFEDSLSPIGSLPNFNDGGIRSNHADSVQRQRQRRWSTLRSSIRPNFGGFKWLSHLCLSFGC